MFKKLDKKYVIVLAIVTVVLCIGIGLFISRSGTVNGLIEGDKIQAIIKVDNNEYIVKENESTGKLSGYKNREHLEDFDYTYNGRELLVLPFSNSELDIINSCEKLDENIYSCSMQQAADYINYMVKAGYSIVYEARTYKFIEYYIQNEYYTFRVIITPNYTIVNDIDNNKIPVVELKDYVFN